MQNAFFFYFFEKVLSELLLRCYYTLYIKGLAQRQADLVKVFLLLELHM